MKNEGKGSDKREAYPQIGIATTCRSFDEYVDMFGLETWDLVTGPVLDVAGGASSFTAQLAGKGIPAVAADPFYAGDVDAVLAAAGKEIAVSSEKLAGMAAVYDWSYYGSPERHREMREASFQRFAADFRGADRASRYMAASLPRLPFADGSFALAVCSHFLFLYAGTFGETFHRQALAELLRVVRPGGEVRVYPLVSLKWEPCPYLPGLLTDLKDTAEVSLIETRLPFIPIYSGVLRLVKRG